MPVILSPSDYDLWLDPGMTKVEIVCDLLKPDAGRCDAFRSALASTMS
jgi:putative SOS response-associated peptidase YedK